MNYEIWTWNELLAFDRTQKDFGAGEFVTKAGKITGMSLFLSSMDFVLQYDGLTKEKVLAPDICSRHGHDYNELRSRQEWTNFELRGLIRELQKYGIKVFFSVFRCYCGDKFAHEWLTDHMEVQNKLQYADFCDPAGYSLLGRTNDHQLLEDIFVDKLGEVMQGYGFDGFHGPDGFGPALSLGYTSCEDEQFGEYLGENCPEELKSHLGSDIPAIEKRLDFIWSNHAQAWREYNIMRWNRFWHKICTCLKPMGKQTMINSPFTEGPFGGIQVFGIDYRGVIAAGVDYFVLEAVPISLDLVFADGEQRQFRHAATLTEFRAFLPEQCKILFLNGVKDSCEGWSAIDHARGGLELEIYGNSQQFYINSEGKLKRCANGMVVCLADGLTAPEWQYLRKWYDLSFGFDPDRAGDLTWIFSDNMVDNLLTSYNQYGIMDGVCQVGKINSEANIDISCIARLKFLDKISGGIFVPNFDLLSHDERRKILNYQQGAIVLSGNFKNIPLPPDAVALTATLTDDCEWGFVICKSQLKGYSKKFGHGKVRFDFRPPTNPVCFRLKFMELPPELLKEFFQQLNQLCTRERIISSNLDEAIHQRFMTMNNKKKHRIALVSTSQYYLCPDFDWTREIETLAKLTDFPMTYAAIIPGFKGVRNNFNYGPLRIPPYGLIVLEAKEK